MSDDDLHHGEPDRGFEVALLSSCSVSIVCCCIVIASFIYYKALRKHPNSLVIARWCGQILHALSVLMACIRVI